MSHGEAQNEIQAQCPSSSCSGLVVMADENCEGGLIMKEEQNQFLSLLGKLPARLTAEQVAWVLNCQPHDVPVLVTRCCLNYGWLAD